MMHRCLAMHCTARPNPHGMFCLRLWKMLRPGIRAALCDFFRPGCRQTIYFALAGKAAVAYLAARENWITELQARILVDRARRQMAWEHQAATTVVKR